MRVAVTGSSGFMGRNLVARLGEVGVEAVRVPHGATDDELRAALDQVGVIFHLAGVNRPPDVAGFERGNAAFTARLCAAAASRAGPPAVVFASSIQAELDNPYGSSKRAAEHILRGHAERAGAPVVVYRLPNVFGKWARPNYNSAVATFCHNIARDLDISIHDPDAALRLVYVDDVVDAFIGLLGGEIRPGFCFGACGPEYSTTVGALADRIVSFREGRKSLVVQRVGTGLDRALYATYVSYLPPDRFAYDVPRYEDARGSFVEVLRTLDSGQFSFFTAHPGVTRGGHYHHSKTEKFVVVKGEALFRFDSLLDGSRVEFRADAGMARVVETIPGWAHDITNVGQDELIVLLWANELFDRQRPDTVTRALK